MFRDRFWWSLALTVPTLVWGDLLQQWQGYTAPTFPGSEYVSPVFGTAVFLYGGRVFMRGAVRELKDRLPGMMTLISLAITVAFAFSLAVTLGFPGTPLWWELATLVTIMLLGHWIEMRSVSQADRAAFWLTVVAVSAGLITLVAWLIAGATGQFAIQRVVTVLVIACPHALGLAIPLVVAISNTLGARSGLLVRDRRGLEEARKLDAVIFDKTGTLTRGEFRVVAIETTEGLSDDDALRLVAGAERDSEHTIAGGIVESAREHNIDIPSSEDFENIPGHGVRATVEGRAFHVGGPAMLRTLDAEPPESGHRRRGHRHRRRDGRGRGKW